MIVLPHGAIKRLVEKGRVEVWSPQEAARVCDRCGARMASKKRCPRCSLATDGMAVIVAPNLTAEHAVRRRADGEGITHARARGQWVKAEKAGGDGRVYWQADPPREAALQDLTLMEAVEAGFKNRDEFYDWWRRRYRTGPLMDTIPCWVVTYELVVTDGPMFLARPTTGADYASAPGEFPIDDLEAVDAEAWARQAEKERELHRNQQRALWRARRRRKRPKAA